MTDRDVTTLSDDDLAQHIEQKRVVVARAVSLRDAATEECQRLAVLHATAEAEGSSQVESLAQVCKDAERARHGRLGALANAQRLLDLALTEQARRAALGAEAQAVAARDALRKHVEGMARVALEASKAMTALRTTLRELAQECRTNDNIERKTQGTKPKQHVLGLDEYADRVLLETESYGLSEVVSVLCSYDAGELLAQINARNAAGARQRAAVVAQQGVAG